MLLKLANELNYSQYLIYGKNESVNLDGFEYDVNAYICDENLCFFVEQNRLKNPNLMLVLTCKFKRGYNFYQISDYLENNWLKYICYSTFERHEIIIVNNILYFFYVTHATQEYQLGVTGVIIVK